MTYTVENKEEIVVTEAMIEAGKAILSDWLDDSWLFLTKEGHIPPTEMVVRQILCLCRC